MYSLKCARQIILTLIFVPLAVHSAGSRPQMNRRLSYSKIFVNNAPYIVQLRDENGAFFCAGTLVAAEFVITAAECFDEVDSTKATVVIGAATFSDEGEQRKIIKITKHPDYETTNKFSNVAVLKLNEPFEVGNSEEDNIITIPLAEVQHINGKKDVQVQVVGWRQLYTKNPKEAELYSADIYVPSQEECASKFNITPQHKSFCVLGSGYNYQFNVGDLGGPAVRYGDLTGIITSCHNCDTLDYALKFTDIFQVRPFIESAMK